MVATLCIGSYLFTGTFISIMLLASLTLAKKADAAQNNID